MRSLGRLADLLVIVSDMLLGHATGLFGVASNGLAHARRLAGCVGDPGKSTGGSDTATPGIMFGLGEMEYLEHLGGHMKSTLNGTKAL